MDQYVYVAGGQSLAAGPSIHENNIQIHDVQIHEGRSTHVRDDKVKRRPIRQVEPEHVLLRCVVGAGLQRQVLGKLNADVLLRARRGSGWCSERIMCRGSSSGGMCRQGDA